MKRSPMLISMIKEWADKEGISYYPHGGTLSEEVIQAWVDEHDEQKPIVFEDTISGDKRKITIFCSKCAHIHKMYIEPGIRSYGDKLLEAQCEGKYWNTKPYLYIDILPVSKKEEQILLNRTEK